MSQQLHRRQVENLYVSDFFPMIYYQYAQNRFDSFFLQENCAKLQVVVIDLHEHKEKILFFPCKILQMLEILGKKKSMYEIKHEIYVRNCRYA